MTKSGRHRTDVLAKAVDKRMMDTYLSARIPKGNANVNPKGID